MAVQSGLTTVALAGERSRDGAFKLTAIGGIEGTRHSVEAASDLGANDWSNLADYTVTYSNAEARVEFVDQSAPNFASRFYRVVVSGSPSGALRTDGPTF